MTGHKRSALSHRAPAGPCAAPKGAEAAPPASLTEPALRAEAAGEAPAPGQSALSTAPGPGPPRRQNRAVPRPPRGSGGSTTPQFLPPTAVPPRRRAPARRPRRWRALRHLSGRRRPRHPAPFCVRRGREERPLRPQTRRGPAPLSPREASARPAGPIRRDGPGPGAGDPIFSPLAELLHRCRSALNRSIQMAVPHGSTKLPAALCRCERCRQRFSQLPPGCDRSGGKIPLCDAPVLRLYGKQLTSSS